MDGSKVPPNNSVEASSSNTSEAKDAKKVVKLIILIKTISQQPEDILITTCSQAHKEANNASQPSNSPPIEGAPIHMPEPIMDKPLLN